MAKERNVYLDFVRGGAILLVVFAHLCASGQAWRTWIYSFHMPLFFVLSGVLAKPDVPFVPFLKKKVRSLYLPYAVFLLADSALAFANQLRRDSAAACLKTLCVTLPQKLLGIRFSAFNGPLWFLFVLFVVQLVFYIASKHRAMLCASVVLTAAGTAVLHRTALPDGLLWGVAVPAYVFFSLGFLSRSLWQAQPSGLFSGKRIVLLIPLSALTAAHIRCALNNGGVDLIYQKFGGNTALFFLNALSGSVLFFLLCAVPFRIAPLRRAVVFFGENSVIVLITHFYMTGIVFRAVLDRLGLGSARYALWSEAALLLLAAVLLVPVILLCRKYLYVLFGLPKPSEDRASRIHG